MAKVSPGTTNAVTANFDSRIAARNSGVSSCRSAARGSTICTFGAAIVSAMICGRSPSRSSIE
ncbi:hypothetical protein ACFV6G_08590 [Streptomyces lavendulae]|uniref:hypothetical protein n=1 Tax=Streptomyces lavendulae TaxID=1914 RepID=UPI0036AB4152